MATQLRAPDLINPYQLLARSPADSAFIEDLGLNRLLDQVPFNGPLSRTAALQMLVELECDQATLEYRQQLFADLVGNPDLHDQLELLMRRLLVIHRQSSEFGWASDLPTGLSLLRNYRDLLRNQPDFSSAKSAGLQALTEYLVTLAASTELEEIDQFLQQIEQLGGLELRVSVDSKGVPSELSTVRLVDQREADVPGFLTWDEAEAPLHRRQSLRDQGGLNNLGQLLQNFLSREYLAVIYRFNASIAELATLLVGVDLYWSLTSNFNSWQQRGMDICLPEILPAEQREASIVGGCNPLIESQPDTPLVANDIHRDSTQNLVLITGANNGGKTTYIKTAGLIQLLGQSGLYVPAKQARFSRVDGIFSHFVAADDIGRGEGRYRNELRRMRFILEQATPFSLVILDEPCGGTDYLEGQRQSKILLQGFHLLGAATYFTTHMHEMAASLTGPEWSALRHLRVMTELDGAELKYLYQVTPGIAERSYGEQIAALLGLAEPEVLAVVRDQASSGGYTELLRE
ncbi:MAG: hypothetical protein JKY89_02365 [Immundisolibacteraceae bacterium]|nr:hypothetical protein [Immundisolibacteraceae bacterium]